MKNLFLKLTIYIALTTLVYSCKNNDSKTLEAIQGKWYNVDGTTKTIEIKDDKWIEDTNEFGKMVYQINQYNDSLTELKVIESTNTITYIKPGMKDYIKIRLDVPSDVLHFEYTDTTGRKGFNCYFTKNKSKIKPYKAKE